MEKKSFKIILKEQAGLMRGRIKEMLKPLDLEIIECSEEKVIINEIKKNKDLLCCIILHIDRIEDYELVEKIKKRDSKAPIIILTTSKKRSFHIKGIQIGVSDLILIPFKDSTLYSKIQR